MQSCCFLSPDFSEQHKGYSLQLVGALARPPVKFDVFCPSVTRFARATSPTSGEVCGTVKTVPYARNGMRSPPQPPIFLVKNTQKTAIFPAVHAVDKAREKW